MHEVYRKQSTRIEDLEKDNKRLEKELDEASGRWRKTEEQLEDLRESSVDAAELKDKLDKAEQEAAEVDALVCFFSFAGYKIQGEEILIGTERGTCISSTAKLASADEITSPEF